MSDGSGARWPKGHGTFPEPVSCNQPRTAAIPVADEHLVKVTHPFHPLAGKELRRVGESHNVAGRRVVCVDGEGVAWAVPIEFTDLVEPSEELLASAGRAVLFVDDLMALAALVAQVKR